jgi:hypothetical protein
MHPFFLQDAAAPRLLIGRRLTIPFFDIIAIFYWSSLFFIKLHFDGPGKRLQYVLNNWLKANRDMIVMITMKSNTFLAFSMPFAKGVWAGAFSNRRIGGVFSVLQNKFIVFVSSSHIQDPICPNYIGNSVGIQGKRPLLMTRLG